MMRAASTYVYLNERLHPGLLDALVRGGVQAIEIYCARQHFDYASRQQILEISGFFKSNEVSLHALRGPKFTDDDSGHNDGAEVNLAAHDKRQRVESMDEIKRALEVAEILPFRYLVQHICKPEESFDERKFENVMACLEHLLTFAKPLSVQLLLENSYGDLSGAEKLVELIRTLHFDDMKICFDVGHAHLSRGNQDADANGVAGQFAIAKDYIRSTHLHDNEGERDHHLWPGAGTPGGVDWAETMRLLRSLPQPPALVIEAAGNDGLDVPAKLSEAFQKLESAGKTAD